LFLLIDTENRKSVIVTVSVSTIELEIEEHSENVDTDSKQYMADTEK